MYRHGAYACTNCCCLQVTKKNEYMYLHVFVNVLALRMYFTIYTVMVNTFLVIKTYTFKAVKF